MLAPLLPLHSTEHSWFSPSPGSHRAPKGRQRAQKGAQSVGIRDLGLCCSRFPVQEGFEGRMAPSKALPLGRDVAVWELSNYRAADVLVQHGGGRGNSREVAACKAGSLCSQDGNLHFQEE